jgi:hypothetical protein
MTDESHLSAGKTRWSAAATTGPPEHRCPRVPTTGPTSRIWAAEQEGKTLTDEHPGRSSLPRWLNIQRKGFAAARPAEAGRARTLDTCSTLA